MEIGRLACLAGLTWLCLGLLCPALPARADGDPALGQYLSATCVACHQAGGRQQGGIPAIAGHPADQFIAMMLAYKTGQRENDVMRTIAGRLAQEEIEALAAYYGDVRPRP